MSKMHHYFSLVVFTAAVMVGIQLPNFVDQYVKRVDAHYQEAETNIAGFVAVAEQFHNGSLESLIENHHRSSDPVFRAEAEPVKAMYDRKVQLQAEHEALQGPLWQQARHIVLHPKTQMLEETWRRYTASLPLTLEAVFCGLLFGTVASLVLETMLAVFLAITGIRRRSERWRYI
jgi:hypothetical protein